MRVTAKRIGEWLSALEARWSLWNLATGTSLVASFGLPAWAIRSARIFSQYAPLSWIVAGFCGLLLVVLIRLLWHYGSRIRINALFDLKSLGDHGGDFNPLDMTFERKRIYLNSFVLPSHSLVDGKTFIDCDIVGPANIYFHSSNLAQPIKPPKVDAVWLHPSAQFFNGFIFTNCIFRNCSFQRVTLFASIENYASWKDNHNLNWISIPPNEEHITERHRLIGLGGVDTIRPVDVEKLIEHEG